MITLEISPDATEDFFAYRCHLYGDLYEIAANTDGIEQNLNKGDSDWVLANPKAPPGYYYKQLNEEGSEIMLDIMGGSALKVTTSADVRRVGTDLPRLARADSTELARSPVAP